MSLERFCRKPVVTIGPNQSVLDAARKMRDHHVGALVVIDDERPVGIVTDRDIVVRAILEGREPGETRVGDVMSRKVATVRSDEKIDDAVGTIRSAGVRRVPIVDAAGKAVGIVSLDDLVVLAAGELGAVAAALQANRGP